MTDSSAPPRAGVRRVISVVLAGLLAVGGGTALAVSSAQQAIAVNPLTLEVPEPTPINHNPYLFFGHGDPGDVVTVQSSISNTCVSLPADATGYWECDVTFFASSDLVQIQAIRADDGTPAQDEETREYTVSMPPTVTFTSPGTVLSNQAQGQFSGSGAFPTAVISGLIGGVACSGVADALGNWTCTTAGVIPDGTYPLSSVQQLVGGVLSDPTSFTYIKDTVGPPWPESSTPYDSTLGANTGQTSDVTPLLSGGAGSAEAFSTVNVTLRDDGTTPLVWPGPSAAFGATYCSGVADGAGAWSCTGAPLTVAHFYVVTMTGVDLAGNGTGGSPDADFGIEILPPPAAPTVFTPTNGFGEIAPITSFGTVDAATTSVRIWEASSDLCGPIAPVALNFTANSGTCVGGIPLTTGLHTLDFIAYDIYGTSSAATTVTNVEAWAPPTILTPAGGSTTSAATVHITGYAPVGSDLEVRLNGIPICNSIPATASYDCLTPLLPVPAANAIEVEYTDPWGTASATVSGFTTVLPLAQPLVSAPAPGYSSTNPVVHIAMTPQPQGFSYVHEGATVLCAPVALAAPSFSCDTIPLSVGVHIIDIAQYDQYGTLSAVAQRTVTILPTPNKPLSMKTFGFTFQVMNPDGSPIDPNGLGTGDLVTIEATGVPPGSRLLTEIHSTPIELGTQLVGPTGVMRLTTTVPAVPPGPHQIVVTASGNGYFPAAFSQPFAVHGLKQITKPGDEIKTLGERDEVKELGTPGDNADGMGTGGSGPGGTNAHGFTDPSVFGSSVESPFNAPAHAFALSPAGILLSGSIAIAFLLLVGLPAELLESTIRSNYDRAFGWMGRLRRRLGRIVAPIGRLLANPWVGSGVTILAASVLLGFADPDFGFNGASVRLVLAMMLAVVTINIGISLAVMKVARRAFDVSAVLKPMPAALAIVAVSVLVSRLAGISPGFLFGVVLGVAYARELRLRDEARLGVLGVGLTIAAGLIAWLGYGLATAAASGPGFINNLIIEALAAITLEALGTLVIALLPIDFLDGRTIFRWSKAAWLGLYALTVVIFLFVVVPLSDNWGTMSAPIFGWGTLFAVFAAVAIITWAVFRRRSKVRPSSPETAEPRQRQRR